jgi:hypothetical protein
MVDSKHLGTAFTLSAAAVVCSTAQAALFRAYLSSTGNDVSPCTLRQPCRLLPAALNAVAAGGEIWMLDSANYATGTVTVNRSVSILAIPGALGSIVAQNGRPAPAITAETVVLRNVAFDPVASAAPGTHGVAVTGSSTTISIENSTIAGVPNYGVHAAGSSGNATASVSDSLISDSNSGVRVAAVAGGNARISLTRSTITQTAQNL